MLSLRCIVLRAALSRPVVCVRFLSSAAPTSETMSTFSPEVEKMFSLNTANSKTILKHSKKAAMTKYQQHEVDTGSALVQSSSCEILSLWFSNILVLYTVSALTEKIKSLTKHFAANKKDHAGKRGFQVPSNNNLIVHLFFWISNSFFLI
jgi:ribosomal protein S15P/S13E